MIDDAIEERVAIKLALAHDVYPDTISDQQGAREDAESEAKEESRRRVKPHGYEQRRLL